MRDMAPATLCHFAKDSFTEPTSSSQEICRPCTTEAWLPVHRRLRWSEAAARYSGLLSIDWRRHGA